MSNIRTHHTININPYSTFFSLFSGILATFKWPRGKDYSTQHYPASAKWPPNRWVWFTNICYSSQWWAKPDFLLNFIQNFLQTLKVIISPKIVDQCHPPVVRSATGLTAFQTQPLNIFIVSSFRSFSICTTLNKIFPKSIWSESTDQSLLA